MIGLVVSTLFLGAMFMATWLHKEVKATPLLLFFYATCILMGVIWVHTHNRLEVARATSDLAFQEIRALKRQGCLK